MFERESSSLRLTGITPRTDEQVPSAEKTRDMTAVRLPRVVPMLPSVLLVVALGLVVGILTSLGQGAGLGPLANSASAWTVPTAAGVLLVRPDLRLAPLLGALGFAADILGYTVASDLRGFPFFPAFWLAVGLVAGPVVGCAAALLLRQDRRQVAVGTGVLCGILLGEGIYGLVAVVATTGAGYWIALLGIAVAAFATVAVRRLRSIRLTALAAAVTAVTVGVFLVGYAAVLPALMLA